jgi:hypothetical protein
MSSKDITGLIEKYFEYCFDGNMLTDEKDIEEEYDDYIQEYFNGEQGLGDWVDDFTKSVVEILQMINYVDEYVSTEIEAGMNMWGDKKKTRLNVYNYYAYAYVMSEREHFLELFKEYIKNWNELVEEEEEE